MRCPVGEKLIQFFLCEGGDSQDPLKYELFYRQHIFFLHVLKKRCFWALNKNVVIVRRQISGRRHFERRH